MPLRLYFASDSSQSPYGNLELAPTVKRVEGAGEYQCLRDRALIPRLTIELTTDDGRPANPPPRNFLLWRLEYIPAAKMYRKGSLPSEGPVVDAGEAMGAGAAPFERCGHCPTKHVLAFRRPTNTSRTLTQEGIPVAGFAQQPAGVSVANQRVAPPDLLPTLRTLHDDTAFLDEGSVVEGPGDSQLDSTGNESAADAHDAGRTLGMREDSDVHPSGTESASVSSRRVRASTSTATSTARRHSPADRRRETTRMTGRPTLNARYGRPGGRTMDQRSHAPQAHYPVVAYGAMGPSGRRTMSIVLSCASYFHNKARFVIAAQLIGVSDNMNEVLSVDEGRTDPLHVVAKFTPPLGVAVDSSQFSEETKPPQAPLALNRHIHYDKDPAFAITLVHMRPSEKPVPPTPDAAAATARESSRRTSSAGWPSRRLVPPLSSVAGADWAPSVGGLHYEGNDESWFRDEPIDDPTQVVPPPAKRARREGPRGTQSAGGGEITPAAPRPRGRPPRAPSPPPVTYDHVMEGVTYTPTPRVTSNLQQRGRGDITTFQLGEAGYVPFHMVIPTPEAHATTDARSPGRRERSEEFRSGPQLEVDSQAASMNHLRSRVQGADSAAGTRSSRHAFGQVILSQDILENDRPPSEQTTPRRATAVHVACRMPRGVRRDLRIGSTIDRVAAGNGGDVW